MHFDVNLTLFDFFGMKTFEQLIALVLGVASLLHNVQHGVFVCTKVFVYTR